MGIDRINCAWAAKQGHRLQLGSKRENSRSLRRYLERFGLQSTTVAPDLKGPTERSEPRTCDAFQVFASAGEGYSPRQLMALEAFARAQLQRMEAAGLQDVPFVKSAGVKANLDLGIVLIPVSLELDLPTASLKELQQAVKVVTILGEFLKNFAEDPNGTALLGCPVYRMRNLPSRIAPDEQLWCVRGTDAIYRVGGVLEWCYDEADALDRLAKMREHPYQFPELKAESFLEAYKGLYEYGGAKPVVQESLSM